MTDRALLGGDTGAMQLTQQQADTPGSGDPPKDVSSALHVAPAIEPGSSEMGLSKPGPSGISRFPEVTSDTSSLSSHRVQPVSFDQLLEPIGSPAADDETVDSAWTLDRLEQIALANHPAVSRAEAQVRALRGKWVQVGLPPNPSIGYLADEMGEAGTAGQQGAFVAQRFVMGGKLGLSRAVVQQEVARAEQQWVLEKQRVLTDVRVGFYNVLLSQRKLELVRELASVSDTAVRTSQDLLRAQEISRVALLQTEIVAEKARVLLQQTENKNTAVWRRLTSVLGLPDMEPRRLHGALDQTGMDLDWQTELRRLMIESPEIATAMAEIDRAQWQLDRAYAEAVPDVDVKVAVQRDHTTGDTVTGVQVGIPIPLLNRNQGGIQQADAQIVAAERNLQRVELDLRRRLAVVLQQYADARFQAAKYSSEILPKAKKMFDLISEGYKQGEVGYLELLAAQRTYFETSLSSMDALGELWTARLQIDGLLLEDSLRGDRSL